MIYKEEETIRVDKYIPKIKKHLSRNQVQQSIEKGEILVNNKKVKPSYLLEKNDKIEIDIKEKEEFILKPEEIPLDIVYEDEDILLVNKEAGQVIHPAPGHKTGTLVHGLIHYTDDLSSIGDENRPGIVHRLDKDTAGLLVIAKNNEAHIDLQKQWKKGLVKREYRAFVQGRVGKKKDKIETFYGRHPKNRQQMAVLDKGRPAITYYEVLSYHNHFTYIKAILETGRTHQIRVHMAYINHPILGDDVYGGKRQIHNMPYQALCAKKLGFFHPRTGKYLEFEGKLPKYMERLLHIED